MMTLGFSRSFSCSFQFLSSPFVGLLRLCASPALCFLPRLHILFAHTSLSGPFVQSLSGILAEVPSLVLPLGPLRFSPFGFFFIWRGEVLGLDWVDFVFIIMGPGRSSSLRIGGDSSVVVSTGRARGASGRSAISEPQNAAEAPPLPFDEGKEKINLITYPGGVGFP